jgi:hypothetical protein
MQKLRLKSINMLCRNCTTSHTEHNKIVFAIFGFFYDFILNLQVTGPKSQTGRIYLCPGPWNFLKRHKPALGFCTQALGERSPSQPYPLAAEQAHQRRGRAGGGKQVRGMGDWTHVWPICGGGSSEEGSDDGRRRSSGSTAAAARVPRKCRRC